MSLKKTQAENDSRDPIIVEAQRYRDQRANTYREQALKIYPWICARCGREFSGKKLRELTVHHRDHNHDNNPPDGSNWELLCLYCHENEHARQQVADAYGAATPGEERYCQVDEKLVDRPPRCWAPTRREPAMLGIETGRQPQLDCEHDPPACRGRSVTPVGAGGRWPDPQLD